MAGSPSRVRPTRFPGLLGAALVACTLAVPSPVRAQAVSAAVASARQAYAAGEWEEAAAAYRVVVAETPGNSFAWFRLGRSLLEAGVTEGVSEALDRSVAEGFQSPFVAHTRARLLMRLGRREEALAELEGMALAPAVGGRATFEIPDFELLAAEPRFIAVLEAADVAMYPCQTDSVVRQFDFWIGQWDVFANGVQVGTNRIEPILHGCALLENWTNASGREGKSFNYVDRSTRPEPVWRQLWIADQGNVTDYTRSERREDGGLRFWATGTNQQGVTTITRMTFTPVHADTVLQVFDTSTDDGATWQPGFRGTYVRHRDGM